MNQYLYDIEGERHVGTLRSYCRAVENCHYSSFDLGPLLDLYGNEASFTRFHYTSDDYDVVTLQVAAGNVRNGEHPWRVIEEETYRIDLRA